MSVEDLAPTDAVWPEYLPIYGAAEITLPEKLYHYTNAEGLAGILSSNLLWASHYAFLNDKGEFDYCKRLIAELVTECSEGDASLDRFRGMLDDLGSHINQTDAFIVSLCGDGDSLHAWRAYGDGGRGYSIGLVAREIGLRVPPNRQEPGFSMLPVIYDREQQQAILRPKVEQVLKRLRDRRTAKPETFPEYQSIEELFADCLTEIVSFKHPAFHEEKEYRIVFIRDPFPDPPTEPRPVRFRPRGGLLVPYVAVDISPNVGDHQDVLPIADIVIGPRLETAVAKIGASRAVNTGRRRLVEIRQSIMPIR
jgi:hypothetical protein